MSRKLVGAWIEPDIKQIIKRLATLKGISLSEYLRSLILEDLDSRTIFTDALKEAEA